MNNSGIDTELPYSNWRDLEAQLLWIYEGPPVLVAGRFQNRDSTAWLMQQGELEIEGASRVIGPGEWVFAPQKSHKREFSRDARIVSVKFSLRWPDDRLLFEPMGVRTATAKTYPKLERTVRPLLKYVQKNKLEAGNLMHSQALSLEQFIHVERLFGRWLLAYLEVMVGLGGQVYLSRREDVRLVKAQRWLDEHPLDKRLDLHLLASRVGLSLGHADTLFHHSYGQTMRAYYDSRRFHAACHWLGETKSPVKEIAFSLGFQDATAFSHWFKKHAKLAPRYYRNQRQA